MRGFTTDGLLPQQADIYERSKTVVGTRPVAPTPTLRASALPCLLWEISTREQATIMGVWPQASHRIILQTADLPTGFGIQWEIVVDGKRYRVQDSSDAGGMGEVTKALLEEVPSA